MFIISRKNIIHPSKIFHSKRRAVRNPEGIYVIRTSTKILIRVTGQK